MSTVGLKLGALVIRTISKPIATAIKAQARDHPTFRRICIRIAQSIHRTDMRLRLGLLRDVATIERLEAAEKAAKAAEKAAKAAAKEKAATPGSTSTSASSASSTSATSTTSSSPIASPATIDSTATLASPKPTSSSSSASSSSPTSSSQSSSSHSPAVGNAVTESHPITTYTVGGRTYHIRPLSETKAIDRGATFISEFFLFAVAGSLILFESLRARRKENNRQDIVTERLEKLEERTRQDALRMEALEEEVWRLKGGKGPRPQEGMEVVQLWEADEGKIRWWRKVLPWSGKKEDGEEKGKDNAVVDKSARSEHSEAERAVAARTTS